MTKSLVNNKLDLLKLSNIDAMDLKSYLSSLERGEPSRFAEKLGVSISYLSQLASGKSPVSVSRCLEIETKTDGMVTRRDLRPDDWMKIWPELAD